MKTAVLDTDVQYVKGVGPAKMKLLNRLDVFTVRDLLAFFPRDYEDRTHLCQISELQPGQTASVAAVAAENANTSRIRPGLTISKVKAVDETGCLYLVFFNQEYTAKSIVKGETYLFYGRVGDNPLRLEMSNPAVEHIVGEESEAHGRMVAIYRGTAGLSGKTISKAVQNALTLFDDSLPEPLPREVRQRNQLCSVRFAYENIHFPQSEEALETARRRLVFEELFILSAGLALLKKRKQVSAGLKLAQVDMQPFYAALPYSPTGAQLRAIEDAQNDMLRAQCPMNRLLQGDVGSGKTCVAAACAYIAAKNGLQSAIMAPTEILAAQHYKNLQNLFERLGISCALLTGSTPGAEKRALSCAVLNGEIDVLIGTHALLEEQVSFARLGFAVCDEQHRFGVRQRALLTGKTTEGTPPPHCLVMSATPIPRTLALVMYGDMEVSVIDELPPGRQKVQTYAVGEDMRDRINGFIRKQVSEGRQVYIVCPLVEDNEGNSDLKPVVEYAENLKTKVFVNLRVEFIHGRQKSAEKERIMRSFADGEIDILVSTTVIEVGVDNPNATVMIVENAERFGLSQLHQLRGRVGRGAYQSYCILFSEGGDTSKRRLDVMCATNDGFVIAQKDLELRGPGDFFGQRQHGLPELKIASFSGDMRTLKDAQVAAADILSRDPLLKSDEHRELAEYIRAMFAKTGSGELFLMS